MAPEGRTGSSDAGAAPLLPEDFHFGVATAGFQIEGGFNGPGQPANNWAAWERSHRVEASGAAIGFWTGFEDQLDRVAAIGCDSFRLSVEWARVEPEEGVADAAALAHYARILDACRARGLMPLVTLHHFTHPAWLGTDLWLRPDAPQHYARWVDRAVDALGDRCRHWVTLNEPNVLAIESYLVGSFPPGRRGDLDATVRALDNLYTAHVLGYERIRTAQPDAVVATNNYALSIYELDRLPLDVLAARQEGVTPPGLGDWLAGRRRDYRAAVGEPPARPARFVERLLTRVAERRIPLERALPRTVSAAETATSDRLLDVAQVDYYNPRAADHLRLPGHRSAGGRVWEPARRLWDDHPDPTGLVTYCEANRLTDLPLWVVENGLCNRVEANAVHRRGDGWDRPRYLREHLAAVVEARARGVPVAGYWHWTLADNYEWGSYEPRFGLFGVDRSRGNRWSELDAMGRDAADAYRRLIAGLRAGDADVLVGP